MATRTLVKKPVRGFVIAWTMITVVVAAVTFFAIYLTYDGGTGNPLSESIALPSFTNTPANTQIAAAVTLPPTLAPRSAATATTAPTEATTTEDDAPAPTDEPNMAAAQNVEPTPTMTPTTLPAEDESFDVGIQVQYSLDLNRDNQDIWMNDVANNLGLGWFKMQVRWEDVERSPGEYDWSKVRLAARSGRRYGLRMMVSVVTTPDWAREPGAPLDVEKEGPPADPQDYVNFVTVMLNEFPGMIHGVEVWNEQNLDREWLSNGGLDAGNYVDLLRRTYQAIKAIDPGIIVISGALAPSGGWTEPDGTVSAIDDFVYLDGMIAEGMLEYTDCVGVHHNGYNIGPSVLWNEVENDPTATFRGPFDNPHHSWSFRSTLQTYADKIRVAGYDTKLCITEFGWAVTEDLDGYPAGFEFANDNTLEEQAEWTVEALNNMEEWGFVWLAFVWNLNYAPQAGWDTNNDNVPYSLIGPDWVHRPAYSALAEWQRARRED